MAVLHRTAVSDGRGPEFVLSDATMDRHGTRLNPNGWDLSSFLRNPVALFSHQGSFPIGRWVNVRVVKDKLVGTLEFAAAGTSARIDELRSLVEQGILRAVSVGFAPIRKGDPRRGEFDYEEQELLEVSLVSVPSNPAALSLARSIGVSEDTMHLAFGEQAGTGRRGINTGEHADLIPAPKPSQSAGRSPSREYSTMKPSLSQRIEDALNQHAAKRERLAELENAEVRDSAAIDEINASLGELDELIVSMKRSEQNIGINAGPAGGDVAKPAVARRPLGVASREVKGSDTLIRAAVCTFLAHKSGRSVESIVEERYPGHEATLAVATRTAVAVATTTTSGWASQLVETATAEFMSLLPATSIYPVLRDMGMSMTFGPNSGAIKIPFSSSTDALAGGFVLEGDPIPVGRMTLDSVTLTPTKFGIIVPMTKEAMRYTNPALESIVRSELLNRTAIKLDTLLIDSTAGSATRPAGLLYGVSPAGSAYGGGDYQAFLADINTLLAPFDTANAGRSLALLMNPAQARKIRMMAGPNSSGFGWANQFLADFRVIPSTTVTAGTIIAVDTADFVTSTGDSPMFETSDQATIHMETSPSPISATGTPNTVAAPVRSLFQTNSVALKMTLDVSWAMRRSGMVQYLSGVTW